PSVFTPTGAASAQPGGDGWREWVTCTMPGTIPGGVATAQLQVMVERPVLQPVQGLAVEPYLAGRPEALIKQRCPDFPYTAVAEVSHGFACYLRVSPSQAQGLVAGAMSDSTGLVTVTVTDANQSPAQLRTAAEQASRTVAVGLIG